MLGKPKVEAVFKVASTAEWPGKRRESAVHCAIPASGYCGESWFYGWERGKFQWLEKTSWTHNENALCKGSSLSNFLPKDHSSLAPQEEETSTILTYRLLLCCCLLLCSHHLFVIKVLCTLCWLLGIINHLLARSHPTLINTECKLLIWIV
jgi:hypothetical protein